MLFLAIKSFAIRKNAVSNPEHLKSSTINTSKDESKYRKEISELDQILRDNGYTVTQIKIAKTRVRNRIREERER